MSWDFQRVAGPYQGSIDGLAWDGTGMLCSVPAENAIYRFHPDSGTTTTFRAYTSRTRGIAFDRDGNLFGCQAGSRRLVRFNKDGSASPMPYRLDGHFHNYPDDLAIDRQGRVWFSDPYSRTPSRGPQLEGFLDHASVLRLELAPNGSGVLHRMTFDTTAPRGVLLSHDERLLYVAETDNRPEGRRELRVYPIQADDKLGPPIVLYRFGTDDRTPGRGVDGMCLDAEGNIFACAGSADAGPGPCVYIFDRDGRLDGTQPLSDDRSRNCAFGDEGLRTLYVGSTRGYLYRVEGSGHHG